MLRDMKNGTASDNNNVNITTLIAEEYSISKALSKLYTKCLSKRRITTARKNTNIWVRKKTTVT